MQRLVAQHREIHMFLTCVRRGREWGPTRWLKHSCQYTDLVHDEIMKEIHKRQGTTYRKKEHTTPYNYLELPKEFYTVIFEPTIEMLRTDVTQLREKWEREGYFHGVGRTCLTLAEKAFDLSPGRPKDECLQIKDKTRKLIRENKDWFESYRKDKPASRMQDRVDAFQKWRDSSHGNDLSTTGRANSTIVPGTEEHASHSN